MIITVLTRTYLTESKLQPPKTSSANVASSNENAPNIEASSLVPNLDKLHLPPFDPFLVLGESLKKNEDLNYKLKFLILMNEDGRKIDPVVMNVDFNDPHIYSRPFFTIEQLNSVL